MSSGLSDNPRIFAYGSLIFRPGFAYLASYPAVLQGYRRDFCRYSVRHRGTPAYPGLVVALRPGGLCEGLCYEIDAADLERTIDYLDEREGPGYVRASVELSVHPSGRRVSAITYLANTEHATYQPDLTAAEKVERLATARGNSGIAYDYLHDLIAGLAATGIRDATLEELLEAVVVARKQRGLTVRRSLLDPEA